MGDVADGDLHDEAFGAGDAVALSDLGNPPGDGSEALELVAGDGDLNKGAEGKTDDGWIDLSVVTADGTGVFEFSNALDDCGGREGDAATQFGEGETGVSLKLREDGGVDGIEARIAGERGF